MATLDVHHEPALSVHHFLIFHAKLMFGKYIREGLLHCISDIRIRHPYT
jgi:hypothetical protein